MKRSLGVWLLAFSLPANAYATTPEEQVQSQITRACALGAVPPTACETSSNAAADGFEALERPGGGVSYADERSASEVVVDVGNFYFAPRVLQVDADQTVIFRNTSVVGGPRHKLVSSDPLGARPVLPVPGPLSFGGGCGWASPTMLGGDDWPLVLSDPVDAQCGSALSAPSFDKVIVPYHCNIHGASQMSGYLVVRTKQYGGSS